MTRHAAARRGSGAREPATGGGAAARRARRAAAAALAVAVVAATPARAGRLDALGSYEREAVEEALARLGVEVDERPAGKRVRRIHVVNLPVFGKDAGFLRVFNALHVTTRTSIVAREVFIEPGEPWDEEVVEDNRRRLNDGLFTALAAIVPVRSPEPGTVDVLVVTRDIWSLRMNSNIEVQDGVVTALFLTASENNLLGLRKHVSFVFDMDKSGWAIGPQYVDKNVLGTRLQLVTLARAIFRRDAQPALATGADLGLTGDFEGTSSRTDIVYPLWSLRRRWGAGLSVSHFDSVTRRFFGTEVAPFPLPVDVVEPPDCARPFADAPLRQVFDRTLVDVSATATRSYPGRVIHRLSWGYQLRRDRSHLRDRDAYDPALVACFESEALPRSELSSALTASYRLFTPRFVRYRNVDSFDLAEDATLGPSASAAVEVALEALGSDTNYVGLAAGLGWTVDWRGDGFVRVGASASTRIQQRDPAGGAEVGGFIDNSASASVRAVPPPVGPVRFVGAASAGTRFNEQANRIFALGGDNGLRGFPINFFQTPLGAQNHRFARANIEARTAPVRVWFWRAGLVAFYDVGGVSTGFRSMDLYHDVGIGLRTLIPQLQPFVFRLDWAVPLNGPTPGLAGSRVVFASQQAF
ncbi:MAG: hypothetical protein D6689_09415 [Deltaproteobacteria bacterium]|nr:MAG: hypothetical protein D6689_09415 [Deltaproteobacteria bacterium]